ncbi:MAG: class I SAM-dependent methyltransferase [Chloroflexota bacterium]|nr:class I SAM-dependent methyltransferase [Chloroflexota bacterium]
MSAFDPLAPTYDHDFTASPIAAHLRARVHARLDRAFGAGDSVLELGCGTGEDALRLAQRGVRVLATDASDGMLAAARAKTAGEPLIMIQKLDLSNLTPQPPLDMERGSRVSDGGEVFDAVYANFGVLNCVDDWRPLALWLSARVRSGGIAGFGVMSPFCVWEIMWHGLHGEWGVAFRRLRGSARFDVGGGAIAIHYPTIRRLTRDFAPHFKRVHVEPLGVLLPPSDVYGAIERRPRWLRRLLMWDARIGQARALALFADHYWIEFERR